MSKLPKEPDYGDSVAPSRPRKTRPASIRLDVPVDQLKGIEIDAMVEITVSGKVVGTEMVERKNKKSSTPEYERSSIRIEDPDIIINDGDQDFSKLAED